MFGQSQKKLNLKQRLSIKKQDVLHSCFFLFSCIYLKNIFHMKKPSKIKCINAKKAWIMLPNFTAITLFGTAYCKTRELADSINKTDKIDSLLESHETIHVRQAESTKDSWFIFYTKYIWQWIKNLPLIFINLYAPYKFIPFEIEAYRYQNDWNYCLTKCEKWKRYNMLTLKQKRILAKEYYGFKTNFSEFIKYKIDPLVN